MFEALRTADQETWGWDGYAREKQWYEPGQRCKYEGRVRKVGNQLESNEESKTVRYWTMSPQNENNR